MRIRTLYIIILAAFIFKPLYSQSILTTVHNLSIDGSNLSKESHQSDVCNFCHTHHIKDAKESQWDKSVAGHNYTLYNSSTIQASPGQPNGVSLLCLSCHDGTIAKGNLIASSTYLDFSSGITELPHGRGTLGTDLSDDHPVSFTYNSSLSALDGELTEPTILSDHIKLENEQVQCTTCHDPHQNIYKDFLVLPTQYSELCINCHRKDYWDSSSHKVSNATWNGAGNNPWFHTEYNTVAENACENCHNPHGADGHDRLMNYSIEEQNCLNCHNGNVATKDIQGMLAKRYSHNVYNYTQTHDPQEENIVQTKHVECEDCHNPHASKKLAASAPNANGFIEGVKGVDTHGNSVNHIQFEYELCYRCHGDSPAKPGSTSLRLIEQNNVRLEFDLNNPSYHPVEGPGKNGNVPSLMSPYSESSIIYCTDCHASDGNNSPAGPHGSIYPHILKYRYEISQNMSESYQAYELCYQCHSRDAIINSETSYGKKVHQNHIVRMKIPCNTCHDSHGVSNSQGTTNNNSHLINFDISIVEPNKGINAGRLEFIDLGDSEGQCYLSCHGKNHDGESY